MVDFENLSHKDTAGDHDDASGTMYRELFRELFDTCSDPMLMVSLEEFLIVQGNMAASVLFGYGQRFFAGMRLDDLFLDVRAVKSSLKRHKGVRSPAICVDASGESFTVNLQSIYQVKHDKVLLIFRDATSPALQKREEDLRESLALEVMKTHSAFFMGEEHERQRLARQLHSHIGPMMVSQKFSLEQLLSGKKRTISRTEVKNILEHHQQTIAEIRRATSRLAEGIVHHANINAAIDSLLKKYIEFSGMQIYCKLDKLPDGLPDSFCYHLFQVLEESLTNMIKHAMATRATVRLQTGNNRLILRLHDNGCGMSRPFTLKDKGIWLMQKRAELLSGQLQVASVPGVSFTVTLDVAMPKINS